MDLTMKAQGLRASSSAALILVHVYTDHTEPTLARGCGISGEVERDDWARRTKEKPQSFWETKLSATRCRTPYPRQSPPVRVIIC
jgi:hypothetical protein